MGKNERNLPTTRQLGESVDAPLLDPTPDRFQSNPEIKVSGEPTVSELTVVEKGVVEKGVVERFDCRSDAARNGPRTDCADIDWSAALIENEGWLRSVLAARLGERDAVDEVFQEVAVAAVSTKNPPTVVDRVAPWLYKVAVRRALMYRRSRGRQRRAMRSYADAQSTSDTPDQDPLIWLLNEERQAMVRQALGQLHHRDREIVLLKYTHNWSYKQIAEHLGVTASSIESRLHRARKKMRGMLARQ